MNVRIHILTVLPSRVLIFYDTAITKTIGVALLLLLGLGLALSECKQWQSCVAIICCGVIYV